MSFRRRPISPYWDGDVNSGRDRSSSRGSSAFSKSLRGLVDKVSGAQPDPSKTVVNGASEDKPWLRGLIADLATQLPRLGADIGLLASISKTTFFDGGLTDDKTYQMEKIVQLAASLPTDSTAQDELSTAFIKTLWGDLQHPPLSSQDARSRYRTADGSNNNLEYPNLGKAGSPYTRTVTPRTLQPGILPNPGVIFDSIFARDEQPREHPNKISSMLFYLASIIIHDVFYTDPTDSSRVKTSSYLDLAPLYGSNDEEQARVRTFRDGLLKPDTFSEYRILGFPPGVAALVICFNRYHNYTAIMLKQINEKGRFNPPKDENDKAGLAKLDEDLFQTARLITCGLYVNIILNDYVRTILNLNRTQSTWTLDPRDDFNNVFDSQGTPQGIGNQVSVEFNLMYRWHSAMSVRDDRWTREAYQKIFPDRDVAQISEDEFILGLRRWVRSNGHDPSKWEIDFGRYQRNERGCFHDGDLVQILTNATEDVACAFGARQVPVVMRLLETMGIQQAREWNVATLNEFRKHFKLEPHKEFSDISADPDIQHALRALYKHPDYVELYPGLVVEDAKQPMVPGSGICLGFTTSRTILSDAVSLVRGDRFYTVDYSPATMTNWGFNQVKSDPDVAQGHCIYNLIMRALPQYYRGTSVYAMFPFVTPQENYKILKSLDQHEDYTFNSPSFLPVPKAFTSWKAVVSILGDAATFNVPWGDHIKYLTGREYMLGNDGPKSAVDHKDVYNAMYCPVDGLGEIRRFYEALTKQLIVIGQERLRRDWFQLDACRDVIQPSHAVFVAKLWHIPLKAKGDKSIGVEVDKMSLALSLMFAYVFLDGDTTRSMRLRKAAKLATDQMSMLTKIVCGAIRTGEKLKLSELFDMGSEGQMLESYGKRLIERMFDNGWDVDTVVANLLPTAAAAGATQSQQMAQVLDLYLTPPYTQHWPDIQRCARSDDPGDFEKLKSYALEAARLAPAGYGLLRVASRATTITDHGGDPQPIAAREQIYVDFVAAGRDPAVFPSPLEIQLDRPRASYIHHGWGMHACIGRQIVEVSLAAQLRVFAQLENLRRAPGPQGHIKFVYPPPNPVSSDPVPSPGAIKVFMKEDWGDFWPFPTTLKLHHNGFSQSTEAALTQDLSAHTGLPAAHEDIVRSSRENSISRSRSRSHSRSRSQTRVEDRVGLAPSPSPALLTPNSNASPQWEEEKEEDGLAYTNGDETIEKDHYPRIKVNEHVGLGVHGDNL